MIADSFEQPKKNRIYVVSTEQKIKGVTSSLRGEQQIAELKELTLCYKQIVSLDSLDSN